MNIKNVVEVGHCSSNTAGEAVYVNAHFHPLSFWIKKKKKKKKSGKTSLVSEMTGQHFLQQDTAWEECKATSFLSRPLMRAEL